jgi:hypothetical protein
MKPNNDSDIDPFPFLYAPNGSDPDKWLLFETTVTALCVEKLAMTQAQACIAASDMSELLAFELNEQHNATFAELFTVAAIERHLQRRKDAQSLES